MTCSYFRIFLTAPLQIPIKDITVFESWIVTNRSKNEIIRKKKHGRDFGRQNKTSSHKKVIPQKQVSEVTGDMMDICKKEKLFQTYLQEQLEDDEFREAWEKLQPYRAITQAVIDSGLTEEELANRSGLPMNTIRKLEMGTINPSVRSLQKLAVGLGKVLQVSFISEEDDVIDGEQVMMPRS